MLARIPSRIREETAATPQPSKRGPWYRAAMTALEAPAPQASILAESPSTASSGSRDAGSVVASQLLTGVLARSEVIAPA